MDQATVAKHTGFLVAGSKYTDYRLVPSSQLSARVLAAQRTGVGNGEESSLAGEHSSAMTLVTAARHLQTQSLRRATQSLWSPISGRMSSAFIPERID